ncbi:DUF4097 family beta strand repeat-containing protein [Nocardia stercoris]|uniref:DUF4097 domain-containing protein n=1 Tax=Nocardia stercoris TaxID=2483361 RepID=A0A3M2LA12_9NOCA|nr:DUF4097 family beta strand repeat-containing protein [Nocardia stercoris]RMI32765.1 hypothetical protein EBN03_12525 [Nocardia stercoris]
MNTEDYNEPRRATDVAATQQFPAAAPISAVLDIPAGQIRILAGERTDVIVEVRPADTGKDRDRQAARQATVGFADNVLGIQVVSTTRIPGPSGSVQITVQLPAGSRIVVTAASAELATAGALDEVTFDGALGVIGIERATVVRVSTASGDVAVGRLDGNAHISTGRGDIRIDEARRGQLVLRTQEGSVSVGAAAGVTATLDAGTTLGRIHNALTGTGEVVGLTIHATTARGDITARTLTEARR